MTAMRYGLINYGDVAEVPAPRSGLGDLVATASELA
jgi:hypothetical protein